MSRRIFWGIFLVTVAVFLACLTLVIGVDYRSYVNEHEEKVRKKQNIFSGASSKTGWPT